MQSNQCMLKSCGETQMFRFVYRMDETNKHFLTHNSNALFLFFACDIESQMMKLVSPNGKKY